MVSLKLNVSLPNEPYSHFYSSPFSHPNVRPFAVVPREESVVWANQEDRIFALISLMPMHVLKEKLRVLKELNFGGHPQFLSLWKQGPDFVERYGKKPKFLSHGRNEKLHEVKVRLVAYLGGDWKKFLARNPPKVSKKKPPRASRKKSRDEY
jgi:hypothetical protein